MQINNSDGQGWRASLAPVLLQPEAVAYVESLREHKISDVGSPEWMKQKEYIEKLNVQAHTNASTNRDDFVTAALVSYDKMKVLIQELLVSEVWRQKVYPLLKTDAVAANPLKTYTVALHEGVILNLLELVMFAKEAVLGCGDSITELFDYCYRKIAAINGRNDDSILESVAQAAGASKNAEGTAVDDHIKAMEFKNTMSSFTLIWYMTEQADDVPLALLTQMLDENDIIEALAAALERPPWIRREKRPSGVKTLKFHNGQWTEMDQLKVCQPEAAAWFAIYNILSKHESSRKYEITQQRQATLGRLRKFMNESLFDQLPPLAMLYRAVESACMGQPRDQGKSSLRIIEEVQHVRSNLMKGQDWKAIAEKQRSQYFCTDAETQKAEAKRLSDLYSQDKLEQMLGDPKCGACGQPATKRCARCHNEWYCTKECQVKAWKTTHKPVCDLIANATAAR